MEVDVLKWSKRAEPGERVVYFSGSSQHLPKRCQEPALKASDEGLVFLAQRPRSIGGYDYEATRVSPRVARILGIGVPLEQRR